MSVRTYLPWVRSGLAGAVTGTDALGGAAPARGALAVTATVNTTRQSQAAVTMYGPGDVLGFDPAAVVRREPVPDSSDAEPNYFPLVELRRPELPWMFTPAAPNQDRLRPWMVLVVLRRDRVTIDAVSGKLPIIHLADATQELPDLGESWGWAHAQVGSLADLTAGAAASSRLVCPRLLDQGTRYLAAIVPAFELGRRAGLGLAVDDAATTTDPAWVATTTALDLPAYLSWEFVTGQEGDFQALVSRLSRVNASTTLSRPFTVAGQPGGLPDLGTWQVPGAFGSCPDPSPAAAFTDRLRQLINGAPSPDLVLPPPLYGRWPAAVPTIDASAPAWLQRLNDDPRYRAVAAVGARIVQERQEDLMASAWRQAGELEAANRLLRRGQLARGASQPLHATLAALTAVQLVHFTGPLHRRVLAGGLTVAATVAASRVPAAMMDGAFRRALRPRGPLGRRSGTSGGALIDGVNGARLVLARPPARPGGLVSVDDAAGAGHQRWCQLTSDRMKTAAGQRHGSASPAQWAAFIAAATAHQQGMPACDPPPPRSGPALDLEGLRTTLLQATDPARTITKRLRHRVSLPPGWNPVDPLEPVWAAPRFDSPLYRDLAALSQDYLIPGVRDVPVNSVTAVATNPRFIEALMVGANHEMSRELLWRGFPTDQRGTYFRRFWDRTSAIGGATDDIPAIDGWTGELGTHVVGGEQVVLIVRGEVLHRYPRTLVYAAQARWDGDVRVPVLPAAGDDPGSESFPERYPVFGGTVAPDITFLGLDLDPIAARGSSDPAAGQPGWFFVFQQPPVEPRPGLRAPSPDAGNELSWTTVAKTPSGHVDLAGGLNGVTVPGWGTASTSAILAALTEQRPFRICIHASDLLPGVGA
jgi:hypothetical protein